MKPIAIFYHCLFFLGNPPELKINAYNIISDQMNLLSESGLEDAASEIIIGINGDEESRTFADLTLPKKSKLIFHGLKSNAENLTIVEMEKWVVNHPDWYVL